MGGISEATGNNILYGTGGYVTVNGTDLGATMGEIRIEMNPEQYYPDLAQARGNVSGTGRVVGCVGTVTLNMAEWAMAVLGSLYSLGYTSDANSHKMGSSAIGTITEPDSVIVTGITRNDLKPFRVTMAKARVTTPFGTSLQEAEISGIEVTFETLYTLNSPSTFPMWVEIAV